jgi:DNA primase
MKFPPSVLDDIKARLPVSAVVGRRVRLIKSGREWKGLSPFGKERTPSFFVNDTKQAWFDFSSGRNGDIFTFLMETEGVSFPEAVERLAAEAGVTLPKVSEEGERQEQARKGLHEAIELACRFFEGELRGPKGAEARRYLEGRELAGEVARTFRLGYAPADRFALRDHLAAAGVSAEVMIDAGLLIHGEDIAVPYDRFRDRVIFPIADARGRVVAFGGRAMSADLQPKYLNTSETTLFHKGRMLYNHHLARKAAHEKAEIIVAEGYVDVIALTLAGLPHAVAPLGTALTEDQMSLLWRMVDEPILCFDGDKAGRKAAYRAIDVALPLMTPGKSLRFAMMPEGQDPDELLRAGGAEAVRAVIAAARPLVDMLWAREVEAAPLDTPERRAAFERRIGVALQQIRDEATRRHYRANMDERLGALFPAPQRNRGVERYQPGGRGRDRGRFGQGTLPPGPLRASPTLARSAIFTSPGVGESPREAFILAGLAAHPSQIGAMADLVAEIDWQGPLALKGAQIILQAAMDGDEGQQVLGSETGRAAFAGLFQRVRSGDRPCIAPDADPHEAGERIKQALLLHRRSRTLHSELKDAELAFAREPSEANQAWLLDVKARLTSLEGTEATLD